MAVTATMGESYYTERAEAFKDKDYQGWTIEVMVKKEMNAHKEYLITLAKNSLFNATGTSKNIYIMGYAATPFVSKKHGFVTVLGDMQDESKACWDLYTKGICSRECACRWQHPSCLTPINVVIKEAPEAPALEYLASSGLSTTA